MTENKSRAPLGTSLPETAPRVGNSTTEPGAFVAVTRPDCPTNHEMVPGKLWSHVRIENDPVIYQGLRSGEIAAFNSRAINNCPDCGEKL